MTEDPTKDVRVVDVVAECWASEDVRLRCRGAAHPGDIEGRVGVSSGRPDREVAGRWIGETVDDAVHDHGRDRRFLVPSVWEPLGRGVDSTKGCKKRMYVQVVGGVNDSSVLCDRNGMSRRGGRRERARK